MCNRSLSSPEHPLFQPDRVGDCQNSTPSAHNNSNPRLLVFIPVLQEFCISLSLELVVEDSSNLNYCAYGRRGVQSKGTNVTHWTYSPREFFFTHTLNGQKAEGEAVTGLVNLLFAALTNE